jgi:hypothetical protein
MIAIVNNQYILCSYLDLKTIVRRGQPGAVLACLLSQLLGRLTQEDHKFKINLDNLERP